MKSLGEAFQVIPIHRWLCAARTQHMGLLVFSRLYKRNIIAMQIAAECQRHFTFPGIQRMWFCYSVRFSESDSYRFDVGILLSWPRSTVVCVFFSVWLHMVLLCGCRCVWSSPCTVLKVITIRPRLVGVIWSSLKLSPGDSNVEVGRNLGGPLYDGCLREVDRA